MRNSRLTASLFCSILLLFAAQACAADSLTKIAKKISKGAKFLENNKVAVLPFPYHDGRVSRGSTIVSERLITKIVEKKKLEVIERSLMEKVLRELKLQVSGAIDQESAKEIGKLLGVEAIVSGTLIDLGDEKVEVNARLIRTETGQIVVAASGEIERLWKDEPISETTETEVADVPVADQTYEPDQSADAARRLTQIPVLLTNKAARADSQYDRRTDSHLPIALYGPQDMVLLESGLNRKQVDGPVGQDIVQSIRLIREGRHARAEERLKALRERLKPGSKEDNVARLVQSMNVYARGSKREAYKMARSVAKQSRFPRVRSTAHFLMGRYSEGAGNRAAAKNHYLEVVRTVPFQTYTVRSAGNRLRALVRQERKARMRARGKDARRMKKDMRRRRR